MYKWTDEDHELVKILTAQGLTVAQISSETGLSVIKRSRAIILNNLAQQVEDNRDELLQLKSKISELEAELES